MNNIRTLREREKLSQLKVASTLGISPQAVSKWERGESSPQWELVPQLAVLLRCTIDELYGYSLPEARPGAWKEEWNVTRQDRYCMEAINKCGETRSEYRKRCMETTKKLAAVLAETTASYNEVDIFFAEAKKYLCVTNLLSDPYEWGIPVQSKSNCRFPGFVAYTFSGTQ